MLRLLRRATPIFITGVFLLCFWMASALALPTGRHYEMVSPPYKGGYGVFLLQATAMTSGREGEGVVFDSMGNFAGQPISAAVSPYFARRETEGWVTGPLLAPAGTWPDNGITDISPALLGLYVAEQGWNVLQANQEGSKEFLFHDLFAADSASFYGPFSEPPFGVPLLRLDKKPHVLLGSVGSDSRFCHVVFGGEEEGALLREAKGAARQVYELVTGGPGCDEAPVLRLVAVSNKMDSITHEPQLIDPTCKPVLGSIGDKFNAVASGGSEIFFATELQAGCETESNPAVLFARLNGEKTIEISTSETADCLAGPCTKAVRRAAKFEGANEAGTRVFFTTNQPLVTGDIDESNDLYMAEIGCPLIEPGCEPARREVTKLVQVSHDPNAGQAARVQGVSVLSQDGGHGYFVAEGVLSAANAEGRAPADGADNLYVYDSEKQAVHFIAELCSGPGRSGAVSDPTCPTSLTYGENGRNDDGLWGIAKELQTNGDGSFFVFATYARLADGDVDAARDIYRYDAQSESLDRISIGEEGYNANGNGDRFDSGLPRLMQSNMLQNDELSYRAMSEDGSRIVFETDEPLSPNATNGLINAYEWQAETGQSQGSVSLVSTGDDEEPVGALGHVLGELMITPSGRDIFFMTVKSLNPQDIDGAKDVYDARLGPGFPSQAVSRSNCQPGDCHDPLTMPAPLLVPGSAVQAPGGNWLPPKATTHKKKKGKTTRARRRLKRHRRSNGKHFRTSFAGTASAIRNRG